MAEFGGHVFCSTLPSGKIYFYEVGQNAQFGMSFPTGWQHVAAMRTKERLSLYLNGELVASRERPGAFSRLRV